MKNIIKTTAYSAVALSSIAYTSALNLKTEWSVEQFQWAWDGDLGSTIASFLNYILGFLWLVAIAFAMYGGFQILTAGWDDDKVKKGKTTLINALLWIFVILISYTLVNWLIDWVSTVWTWAGWN